MDRTYRSAKGATQDKGELRKNAQILVVSESIGIIIPLAYLACLVVVYDGPNAINLGDRCITNNFAPEIHLFSPRQCEK